MGLACTLKSKLESACQVIFGEKWSRNYVRSLQSEIIKQKSIFGLELGTMMERCYMNGHLRGIRCEDCCGK